MCRSNLKHLFRNKLQQLNPEGILLTSPKDISLSIVDATRVVRIIKIDELKPLTFLTWAKNVFSYIEGLPGETAHIVIDKYVNESTVSLTKGRKESGIGRKISNLKQVLPKPKEWQDSLSNKSNKYQLCCLDHFTCQKIDTNKNTYVTKGKNCFMKNLNESRVEISQLFSNDKEENHRLAFHVQYESDLGRTVCVVADDSDIFILLLFTASQCQSTLYFRQGTNKSEDGITYHNVSTLANFLGDICKILPSFHAFFRCSKIMSFKKIMNCPAYGNLLASHSTDQANIPDVMDFIIHVIL